MDVNDLVNSLLNWIPSRLYIGNYIVAAQILSYFTALLETLYVPAAPAMVQSTEDSKIGYEDE